MNGYHKDIIRKHAMHIFQNLKFRPMSAVSAEEQFKIKEALLEIYLDQSQTNEEHVVRQKALATFRKTWGKE